MYILISMLFVFIFLYLINRYFQRDWDFYSIEMERQKILEEEIKLGGDLVEYERDKEGFIKYVRFKNIGEN